MRTQNNLGLVEGDVQGTVAETDGSSGMDHLLLTDGVAICPF